MTVSPESIARERLQASRDEILYSLRMARVGNPFAGEPDPERRRDRLQAKANLTANEAAAVDEEVQRQARARSERDSSVQPERAPAAAAARRVVGRSPAADRGATAPDPDAREKVWGDTIDFVNVSFLEQGAQAARAVGRVAFRNGRGLGSGVLIGENLFLTNHHVIETIQRTNSLCLEFDYERDLHGSVRAVTRFAINPTFFITDPVEGLDFSIVAVGDPIQGQGRLRDFGFSPLSQAKDKHMIGEFANIVQHPQGRFKEVVLRENRLVNRYDDCLHYVADTEPGSSGSPVYNSEWQLIALHHWGGPWIDGRDGSGQHGFEINEGIRISSIVRKLRSRMLRMSEAAGKRIGHLLDTDAPYAPSRRQTADQGAKQQPAAETATSVRVDKDGVATWTVPVEISVRIPGLEAAGTAVPPDTAETEMKVEDTPFVSEATDYSDRQGYLPNFLDNFTIPLPELGPGIRGDAAELLDPPVGANPFELKYHHFSVVLNKKRRLAFYTACMIDGATAKGIGRTSRKIRDLQASDPGLNEAVQNLDDAEADSWTGDERVARNTYSGDEIYKGQKVPGFPNPRSGGRIARMFQKGHLVRRLDPAWGDKDRALEAELDTFHWTNAAPQVGFFNQGKADEDQPGTGRGKLWRAAENYVLRNAVSENQKVISFTGPIFRDEDREYRHIRVPGQFFKVTVWVEGGELRSLALLVDQQQVVDGWPEALGTREFSESASEAEAFQDPHEMDAVKDFLSTVQEIEDLTELDFGEAVRAADIRKGQQPLEVTSDDDLPLNNGSNSTAGNSPISNARPVPDGEPDDLTRIRGVGPNLQRVLNGLGVFRFEQIAAWDADDTAKVGAVLRFPGRIERDDWIGQARRLMD